MTFEKSNPGALAAPRARESDQLSRLNVPSITANLAAAQAAYVARRYRLPPLAGLIASLVFQGACHEL